MGLDMYLSVRKYVSSYNYNADGETYEDKFKDNPVYNEITKLLDAEKLIEKSDRTGIDVEVPVGYWRKANQIHGWFMQFTEEDNCSPVFLRRSALEDLHKECKKILRVKSNELAMSVLPPTPGFFFGAYEIDEWYWKDIEHTVDILDTALADESLDTFIYQASW